jgi:hypothetical protein
MEIQQAIDHILADEPAASVTVERAKLQQLRGKLDSL